MGRYMRKAKLSGEVAVMEVSRQTSLGVLTRSRTLALQKQIQKPSSVAATCTVSPCPSPSSLCYLELRNRRLEKLPPQQAAEVNAARAGRVGPAWPEKRNVPANSCSVGSVSCGENGLETEAGERSTRETTPCSLIRDSESFGTPCSTTKSQTSLRLQGNSMLRDIPTQLEMEEFFATAEQLQHQIFMDKYNFDPVNELPLSGRYQWFKVDY